MPSTSDLTLLLAHADRDARRGLAAQLDLDGYSVLEAATTANVIELLQRTSPAATLLGTLEHPAGAATLLRDLRARRIDRTDAHTAGADLRPRRRRKPAARLRAGLRPPPAGRRRLRDAARDRRGGDPASVEPPQPAGPAADRIAHHRRRRVLAHPGRRPRQLELLRRQRHIEIWGCTDPRSTRTLDSTPVACVAASPSTASPA